MVSRTALGLAALGTAAALALAACSPPAAPTAGQPTDGIVLADAADLGGYNPVAGYGELGVSPRYDGLLTLHSDNPDTLPTFKPALATALPTHNDDFTVWEVPLRTGVTFHDGSTFDAADVVATYEAVLDPASASEIASAFDMVNRVTTSTTATGESVTFTLNYPYADFPARMLLAIAPSEKLTGGPASESSLNREPVGTGPFTLAELSADKAVFTANADYWNGAPKVASLTTVHVPDDNTRAMRVKAGEFDGTSIPPALASAFTNAQGYTVVSARSADWRGVSLPADSTFTRDARVRIALNHAVNRQAMLDTVLVGRGTLAYTPVSPVYGDAFDPNATFSFDQARARQLLDEAGWVPGPDGVRSKGADRASFPLAYNPSDTVRRDLAAAFAADLKQIGVEVKLEALGWDKIEPRIGSLGVLLGGGDEPYSNATQVHAALHTPMAGTAGWDNPGRFGTPAMDAALDRARKTADGPTRAALYREVQTHYLTEPSYVFLVFVDHTYVARDSGWQRGPLTIEPHALGVSWGPWWNLASWTR